MILVNGLHSRVDRFLEDFTTWASSHTDIQAIALIGSYARGTATDSSDVDLMMITNHPDDYLKQTEWISIFGEIERQQIEDYGKVTSIRVWYIGDLEVEYGITDEDWISFPFDEGTRQVIQDGLSILFERNENLSLIRHLISENFKPQNQMQSSNIKKEHIDND